MLLVASVGGRTRVIYKRQVEQYLAFTETTPQLVIFDTESIKQFIAKLHLEGKAHATILTFISALNFHCKRYDITNSLSSHAVKAVLKGAKNLSVKNPALAHGCILFGQLKKLCALARSHYGEYEAALVCCAFSLAFFGFLRVGEYTVTSAGHAVRADGCTVSRGSLMVTIPSSKCNRSSVTIRLRAMAGHSGVCPVQCFQKYRKLRPVTRTTCLLLGSGRQALTPRCINNYLKVLGELAGLGRLTSHAFRVGGATWAAAQGWSDARIRAHGRWASDAALGYVRPV